MNKRNLDNIDEKWATPINEVIIDGLAVLQIVKHCGKSSPTQVAGSLLGLDYDGKLEITYSYPFHDSQDGIEYQIETMKMLGDVNVDNNCVGWYYSMYMGTVCTNDVINYQYDYQSSEALSNNSVVIMYDPILSKNGNLVMKAFRLNDKYLETLKSKSNQFVKPAEILEEVPLTIRNFGHVSVFLKCLEDSHEEQLARNFDPLSMANEDTYTEKHLELLTGNIDDLVVEQTKFQKYSQKIANTRQEHIAWLIKRLQENIELKEEGQYELSTRIEDSGLKPLFDAPPRQDTLLLLTQLGRYCKQINERVDSSTRKLVLAKNLSKTSA